MSGNPEDVKARSRFLRGELAHELTDGDPSFSGDGQTLLKFHGIYQQDDRDVRRERAGRGLALDYSCMVRASIPGGRLTPEAWLALDRLADATDGTLRLTTRQGVQLHFVRKSDLASIVHDINAAGLTTLAACGDVVRNIVACSDPAHDHALEPVVDELVRRFRPRTTAYWELWIDGDKAATLEPGDDDPFQHEPIYGDVYLPRKFKIGIAWPGHNCIDVYSQDIGIVPTLAGDGSGDVTGYVVLVGGGMGRSLNRDDTAPRLATVLGWVEPHELVDAVEHVITVQRDFGNREDRKRARLKYLIENRGIDWFRAEVEARHGAPLRAAPPLPAWEPGEHHERTATTYGLPVPSGRVSDHEGVNLRTAMRTLVANGTVPAIRVTARQDLVLVGVDEDAQRTIDTTLREHGVALAGDVTSVRRLAIACPALPTCGQALGEAERVLPDVIDTLEAVLARHELDDESIRLNMTGCPNGCARPYTSEIGISGRTKRTYDLYLGGSAAGTRLGVEVRPDMSLDELEGVLDPVIARFATARRNGSTASFGDWCAAAGDELATWLPAPVVRRRQQTSAPARETATVS